MPADLVASGGDLGELGQREVVGVTDRPGDDVEGAVQAVRLQRVQQSQLVGVAVVEGQGHHGARRRDRRGGLRGGAELGGYVTLRPRHDAGYADTVHDARAGQLFALRATPGHDHYLRCDLCGRATALPKAEIENLLDIFVRAAGWSSVSHALELTGRCPTCEGERQP